MNIKKSILFNAKISFLVVVLFSSLIIYRIFILQFKEGNHWNKISENMNLSLLDIKANRGSILSDDGSILATSLPFYKVAFDPSIVSNSLFTEKIDSLSLLLSNFFNDRSKESYKSLIKKAKDSGKKYLILNRKRINYEEKEILSKWPIFNEGRLKGGVIFEKIEKRYRPFSKLGYRTIGSVDENYNGTVGLEYSFNNYLIGKDGKALYQKIAGNNWKPVFDGNEVNPENGFDVLTTININIQDIAETALLNGLISNNAEYGCTIIMDVKSGEIKAISNLSRNSKGEYLELYNYAIGSQGSREPGSTFKLASMLALFEDSRLELIDTVDTGKGEYKFYTEIMKDHKEGGYGKITVKDIFEQSSNIGVAKLIEDQFKDSPSKFLNYINKFGLSKDLNFQMIGYGKPFIKNSNDSSWSKVSLPWMAHGYELKVTPLQTLSFYNAIANNGRFVKPIIVKKIIKANNVIEEFDTEIFEDKIASNKSIQKAKLLLEGVVERGTAKNINNSYYKIAGKTGTAKKVINGRYVNKYYTSFVVFFPSDKPQFSCIVVIDEPKNYRIYGSDVAAPVFREISDRILLTDHNVFNEFQKTEITNNNFPLIRSGFRNDLIDISNYFGISNHSNTDDDWVKTKVIDNSISWESNKSGINLIPNVIGMTYRDALYLLEKRGLKVNFSGSGRVKNQSILPGKNIKNYSTIHLSLR